MHAYSTPLVSVIIPFFNTEAFLKQTIESVIAQEYENWELVLVDDGSVDNSTAIAKEFAFKHPGKILYAAHEGHVNKAAAASRNLGIAKTKGELVAFLDADDFWMPQKLKQQVALFEANPQAGMVCEASRHWYSWNNSQAEDVVIAVGGINNQLYQPPQLIKELYPLGSGPAPCPCSVIIKRTVLMSIGGFEESFIGKYQAYEDQAFLVKVYLHAAVFVSAQCNNLYRQRAGSVMDQLMIKNNYLEVRYFFLQWFYNYLQQKKIEDPQIDALLQKALKPYHYTPIDKLMIRISSKLRFLKHRLRDTAKIKL